MTFPTPPFCPLSHRREQLAQPDEGNTAPVALRRHAEQEAQEAHEAREALRRSNERMAAVLESITDGFAVIDVDWSIAYLNAQADAMLRPNTGDSERDRLAAAGRKRGALTGRSLWSAFPDLLGTVLDLQFRHAMAQQESVGFELHYLPSQRWIEVRAYPSPTCLTCYLQDITQRKHDERSVRESGNRLQVALAAGKLGDWRWEADGNAVILGRRAAAILDLPAESPLSWQALRARIAPPDRDAAQRAFVQACRARDDFSIECRMQKDSGEPCWLSLAGHGNFSDTGKLLGITGMVQDISTRKAADDALRQSEEELRALADSIPQLAWIANFDGAVVWYNERWYEYTGVTAEQLKRDGWNIVYAPECVDAMLERWEQSLRQGQPFEMEFPIRGADGQFRWFLTRANPVRGRDGHVVRWFGTSTDVDQVKRVQEALRDESNILELLNNTGSALASTRDLRPLLQEVTDAATRISGARFGAFFYNGHNKVADDGTHETPAPLQAHTGQLPACFPPPGLHDLYVPGMRGAGTLRSDDLVHDSRYLGLQQDQANAGDNGEAPLRSFLAAPVVNRGGDVLGSLFLGHPEAAMFNERTERIVGGIAAQAGVAIDNARLYEAAQQAADERKVLLDSERSARAVAEHTSRMKDEFLSTLSHELRTPLTAILGWAQVLRRGSRDEADLHRGLQTIERNARAQAQLIEDLLDMSRITSGKVLLDVQALSPLPIVDAAIETVRPAADAKQIAIERDLRPGGLVTADASRLQQVVWNLLSNAVKFTPRGGTVRVAVHEDQGQIKIVISDSGIGIKPAFLAHVFERFRQGDSTTTRSHGGLGLGLAIAKQLVEQHGGTIGASSDGEGRGACFTVALPLADGKADAPRAPRPYAPQPPAGAAPRKLDGLRVLVVDDEADARELIARILGDSGADVATAASAAEALTQVRRFRPALLISDIGMPEVDGFQLLAQLRARAGDAAEANETASLPAIALTAFARPEDRLRALEAGFVDHVSKPVEPAELVNAVASAAGRQT